MKFPVRYPAVLGTSVVAGVFTIIVGFMLAVNFAGRGTYELFDSPQFVELKAALRDKPNDLQLPDNLRQLDQELRADYFQRRRFMSTGVYLLLGGVILTLATARWAAALRPRLPQPVAADEPVDALWQEQQWGRWGVVGLVLTITLLLCGYALRAPHILPTAEEELAATAPGQLAEAGNDSAPAPPAAETSDSKTAAPAAPEQGHDVPSHPQPAPDANPSPAAPPAAAEPLPSAETYAAQWPRFRGPTGSGISPYTDLPTQWDVASGEGILWKTELPLPGHNSPIVWQDRVFVSGATDQQQAIFCFDAHRGELLWRLDVPPELGGAELEVMESTGYAPSTLATDGLRIYAIFPTGNLVAADWEGLLVWRKDLGVPKNPYGHASSLATYRDRVMVQYDQGTGKDGKSRLYALDGATGDVVWEVPREVPSSWATPIVIQHDGRTMLITCVAPWVIAYAPEDGQELWRAKCLGGEVGPSPSFANGLVFAANETGGMFAVRVDGSGDVTDSHILWMTDIDAPDVCSPLATGDHVFLLSHGLLGCFDAAPGEEPNLDDSREPVWEEDLVSEISASPSLVGELIYLVTDEGNVLILKPAGDACERVAELEMGEPCRASPAFQPGRIYLRGEQHLFCIGK